MSTINVPLCYDCIYQYEYESGTDGIAVQLCSRLADCAACGSRSDVHNVFIEESLIH